MPNIPEHRRAWQIFEKDLPGFWDRNVVPSVSQLLTWKFGELPNIDAVKIGADRGSKVHHCLQCLDEQDLDYATIQGTDMTKYVDQWVRFKRPGDEWLGIECPLYGTLAEVPYIVKPDRILKRDDEIIVIDIKAKSAVGRPPTKDEQLKHALQVAAQKVAVAQRLGLEVDWAGCLYIWPHQMQLVGYNDARYVGDFTRIISEWAAARAFGEQAEQAEA